MLNTKTTGLDIFFKISDFLFQQLTSAKFKACQVSCRHNSSKPFLTQMLRRKFRFRKMWTTHNSDDGQEPITKAHPVPGKGELKIKNAIKVASNLLTIFINSMHFEILEIVCFY